jgi:hypothetical protein
MYDNWLDSIEDKMGERFRYATEMTIDFGVRTVAWVLFITFGILTICFAVATAIESPIYILATILCAVIALASLFAIFWINGG